MTKARKLSWAKSIGLVALGIAVQSSTAVASTTTQLKPLLRAQNFTMSLGPGLIIYKVGKIKYPKLTYDIYYYDNYPPKPFPSAVPHANHAVLIMNGRKYVGVYSEVYDRPTISGRDVILHDEDTDKAGHTIQIRDRLHIDPMDPLHASTLNGYPVDIDK